MSVDFASRIDGGVKVNVSLAFLDDFLNVRDGQSSVRHERPQITSIGLKNAITWLIKIANDQTLIIPIQISVGVNVFARHRTAESAVTEFHSGLCSVGAHTHRCSADAAARGRALR